MGDRGLITNGTEPNRSLQGEPGVLGRYQAAGNLRETTSLMPISSVTARRVHSLLHKINEVDGAHQTLH